MTTVTLDHRQTRTAPATAPHETVLALLDVELQLTRRMITVAAAQRDALIRSDLEAIPTLARELEGLAGLVRGHEARRTDAVAALAGAPEAALASIAPLFPEPERERLYDLRASLRAALSDLRALTDQNTSLLQQALIITDHGLRIFRAALPVTYGATGAVNGPTGNTRSWQV